MADRQGHFVSERSLVQPGDSAPHLARSRQLLLQQNPLLSVILLLSREELGEQRSKELI